MPKRAFFQGVTVDSDGTATSLSVSVVSAVSGASPTLYSADTGASTIANPLTSGTGSPTAVGLFSFYVDNPGRYTITVDSGGANEQTFTVEISHGEQTQFSSRADLVSAASDGASWPDGTIIYDGLAVYVATDGATTITDLSGLEPFGDWSPAHFGATLDGTDDIDALDAMTTALQVVLSLGTEAEAEASLANIPQRRVDFGGKICGISRTWAMDDIQRVTFTNGTLRAIGGSWGNVNRQVSNATVNFAQPLVSLEGQLTEDLARDFDIQHVTLLGMTLDGNNLASHIYLANTYFTTIEKCECANWPEASGVTYGHGLLTPEGKAGYKNGALRVINCNFSGNHISATPENEGGDGYAFVLQTADAKITSVICYACDYAFYFDRTTNGQLVNCHGFCKGGTSTTAAPRGQCAFYIGSDCAGLRNIGWYNDTGRFEAHSFDHTLADGRFSGGSNSKLVLFAHSAGESLSGCVMGHIEMQNDIEFDTSLGGTFAANLNWAVSNIYVGSRPAYGSGGRMLMQRGSATFPSIISGDRSSNDTAGFFSPEAGVMAFTDGTKERVRWDGEGLLADRVRAGTDIGSFAFNTNPDIQAHAANAQAAVSAVRWSGGPGRVLAGRSNGGAVATAGRVEADDEIGWFAIVADDGTDLDGIPARLVGVATEAHTGGGSRGTKWQVQVTENNTGAVYPSWEFDHDGCMLPVGAARDIGSATQLVGRIFIGGLVRHDDITVADLPGASFNAGGRTMVTDSTVAASGNFGAAVTGGGSNRVPVFSDGTNWLIG